MQKQKKPENSNPIHHSLCHTRAYKKNVIQRVPIGPPAKVDHKKASSILMCTCLRFLRLCIPIWVLNQGL